MFAPKLYNTRTLSILFTAASLIVGQSVWAQSLGAATEKESSPTNQSVLATKKVKAQSLRDSMVNQKANSKVERADVTRKQVLLSSPGGSGGGAFAGDTLLDIYEDQGVVPFSVADSKIYKLVVAPLLADIDTKAPGLSEVLREGLKQDWLLDPKPLSEGQCTDISVNEVTQIPGACQTELEIKLSQPAMENPHIKDLSKGGLLVHELIRYRSIHAGLSMSDEDIMYLTRAVLNAKSKTAEDLITAALKTKFGRFMTADAALVFANYTEQLKQIALPSDDPNCHDKNYKTAMNINDFFETTFISVNADCENLVFGTVSNNEFGKAVWSCRLHDDRWAAADKLEQAWKLTFFNNNSSWCRK